MNPHIQVAIVVAYIQEMSLEHLSIHDALPQHKSYTDYCKPLPCALFHHDDSDVFGPDFTHL